MPDELKLLSCPFCGSAARASQTFSDSNCTRSNGWSVQCTDENGCAVIMACEKKTRNGAIEQWNRRARFMVAGNTSNNPQRDEITALLKRAVVTDGCHHKQFFLEEICIVMGILLPPHEPGIRP